MIHIWSPMFISLIHLKIDVGTVKIKFENVCLKTHFQTKTDLTTKIDILFCLI